MTMRGAREPKRRAGGLALGGESGAALVEFTLVLPLLLVVLFAMTDFGRAFNYWIDESHLANVAARWAAVDKNPGSGSTLQESIRLQADTAELRDGATVCIEFPDGTSGVGDPVEATVTYDFNWLPLIGDSVGVTQTEITGSATMRLEQVPSEFSDGCDAA
jgi:Flp pilus assembly protein TadG